MVYEITSPIKETLTSSTTFFEKVFYRKFNIENYNLPPK